MKNDKISYNAYLSVKENADNNNVSVSSIRRYIRINGIDRKRDNSIIIQRKIKDAIKKEPNISLRKLSRELGYSLNTIKKYLCSSISVSNNDSEKLSTFDTSKKKFIISTVSYSQDEILNNILRLYISNFRFECDITYSIGVFYKRIPQPLLKFDKYPQTEDTLPLTDVFALPNNSISSMIMDLPFMICGNYPSQNFPSDVYMATRFNYFKSPEELYQTNVEMVDLIHDKLKKGGIFVAKTMDIIFTGKQHWVSNFLINTATERGFELVDTFILIAKGKLLRADGCIQRHARKFHSYFHVFRKKK
ncbi:MAG: winged helix-turn-helix domain-containing protein [Muribaculaceae bacterium]|nr:winged helix-turn-helix domain-containing protein [Muribaculaceae bacterium]